MRILCTITSLLSVFVFARNECPMGILPDFCNDKADSRCTFRHTHHFGRMLNVKNHPSKPRDIKLEIPIKKHHYEIMNLTWKPPNDSSISYLRGYKITIPYRRYSYIYDLTQANFTTKDSEIVFSFACAFQRFKYICLRSLPHKDDDCEDHVEIEKISTATRSTTDKTVNFTISPAILHEHPRASKLLYILIGMSIFVLTIVGFSIFLLKDVLCRRGGNAYVDALEDLNKRNQIPSEEPSSEEEDIFV